MSAPRRRWATTSITDSFNTDTVTVNAALAQDTALTLVGSAAEIVTGLVGDIAAGSLSGALTVTTGNAADNGIGITTGSAATSITASGASDVRDGELRRRWRRTRL